VRCGIIMPMTCDLQHPATRVAVRTLATGDHEWVVETLTKSWGSTSVVSRGKVHEAHHLPGLVAETAGIRAGLATYSAEDAQMEVVTLEAVPARMGAGTALLARLAEVGIDRMTAHGFGW
jgi:hypothetical protein